MAHDVLTLKDMTRGSGCTPRTVRYYERQGLLRALRTAGGHRQFAAVELERLNFIISLREAGWSLEEVTEVLSVRDGAASDGAALHELGETLRRQRDRLQRKLDLLQRLYDDLTHTTEILQICKDCTEVQVRAECHACDRVPALDTLPRSFRLIWRARDLGGPQVYDEPAADELEDGTAPEH